MAGAFELEWLSGVEDCQEGEIVETLSMNCESVTHVNMLLDRRPKEVAQSKALHPTLKLHHQVYPDELIVEVVNVMRAVTRKGQVIAFLCDLFVRQPGQPCIRVLRNLKPQDMSLRTLIRVLKKKKSILKQVLALLPIPKVRKVTVALAELVRLRFDDRRVAKALYSCNRCGKGYNTSSRARHQRSEKCKTFKPDVAPM
jgi:hypothetical protein